ncbi:MAG: hypothetical protein PF961_15910 [Planctomycetota bacterium]|jgi:hypothetical protein|nr:hypothetical protein [Planctomycetota bacterium]
MRCLLALLLLASLNAAEPATPLPEQAAKRLAAYQEELAVLQGKLVAAIERDRSKLIAALERDAERARSKDDAAGAAAIDEVIAQLAPATDQAVDLLAAAGVDASDLQIGDDALRSMLIANSPWRYSWAGTDRVGTITFQDNDTTTLDAPPDRWSVKWSVTDGALQIPSWFKQGMAYGPATRSLEGRHHDGRLRRIEPLAP